MLEQQVMDMAATAFVLVTQRYLPFAQQHSVVSFADDPKNQPTNADEALERFDEIRESLLEASTIAELSRAEENPRDKLISGGSGAE